MSVLNENDLTRNPLGFIIIASVRSGGTLLAHSLDSHPLISCMRGEPLHAKSEWAAIGRINALQLLRNFTGYLASGFKIQNDQLSYPTILPYIKRNKLKIIRITRENLLMQAVSLTINRHTRRLKNGLNIPQHSFDQVEQVPFTLPTKDVLHVCKILRESDIQVTKKLTEYNLKSYNLTYEQITLGQIRIQEIPTLIAKNLCDLLKVPYSPLQNFLQRINWKPYSKVINNWKEIKSVYEEYICQIT